MRIVVILVGLSLALGIASWHYRKSMPQVSQVLLGFSILFGVMFFAAFFNLI